MMRRMGPEHADTNLHRVKTLIILDHWCEFHTSLLLIIRRKVSHDRNLEFIQSYGKSLDGVLVTVL